MTITVALLTFASPCIRCRESVKIVWTRPVTWISQLLGYLAILSGKFSPFGEQARISPFINRSAWLIARNISAARDAYLRSRSYMNMRQHAHGCGGRYRVTQSFVTFTRGWVTVTRSDELPWTHFRRVIPRSYGLLIISLKRITAISICVDTFPTLLCCRCRVAKYTGNIHRYMYVTPCLLFYKSLSVLYLKVKSL